MDYKSTACCAEEKTQMLKVNFLYFQAIVFVIVFCREADIFIERPAKTNVGLKVSASHLNPFGSFGKYPKQLNAHSDGLFQNGGSLLSY